MKKLMFSLLILSLTASNAYAVGGLSGALDDISKQIDSSGESSSGSQASQTAPAPPAPPHQPPALPAPGVLTGSTQPGIVPTKPGEGSMVMIDPQTGNVTQGVLNPDGSKTITEMDKNGNVVGTRTVPPAGQSLPSGSAFDPSTGITTAVQGNADGSRTITKTDADGKVIEKRTEPKSKPGSASASAYDPSTGMTTSVVKNADGTRTVTKTDSSGKVLEQVVKK